jgi:hypothetical protein
MWYVNLCSLANLPALTQTNLSHAICIVSATAWGLVYSLSPFEILKVALLMIVRDFILVGAVIASIVWYVLDFCARLSTRMLSITFLSPLADVFLCLSTPCRLFSNTLLLSPTSSTPSTRVEWAYAFDVHTNAFFPVFLILHGLQLVLLPVVSRDGWVWMWLGNSVWVIG